MIEVLRVRADNPGFLTLDGTNTWVLGRDPAWIVDPGPLDDAHLDVVARAVAGRGGCGGVALTHSHADHSDGARSLADRLGAPLAAMDFAAADVRLGDGETFGPLEAIHVPGHAPDHLCLRAGGVLCTGDAVLGAGSVFVADDMAGYIDALWRLSELPIEVILPGHGPVVRDPRAKLLEYITHRLDREGKLIDALAAGARTVEDLLDAAWDDVPPTLRPAAALTLSAHLGKLADEGRLPAGVERP